MRGDFERAIPFTLHEEGGNVDDPDDPGGRTSRGVTQAVWDKFSDAMSWARSDVWQAPQQRIVLLYRLWYWGRVQGDLLAWPLALCVLDSSVLHGTARARQWLAQASTWEAYVALREASYEAIIAHRPSSEKYRRTWMGRCARLRAACQAAAAPQRAAA